MVDYLGALIVINRSYLVRTFETQLKRLIGEFKPRSVLYAALVSSQIRNRVFFDRPKIMREA